ncbi:hypothetical protein VTK26DRAFT_203 [Humicola hyalothermophila]
MDARAATAEDTDVASTGQAPPQHPGEPESRSLFLGPGASTSGLPPPSATESIPGGPSETGPTPFPVSFLPLFFQRNRTPSASIAPSTAEGKPVPVTDTTGTQHTSALQKLNSKYPSAVRRHGYATSTGAQSSTYSQPVLVRTYNGPPPSRGSRSTQSTRYRPPSSNRGTSRRVPLPSSSTPDSSGLAGQPIQPTVSDVGVGTTSSTSGGINNHSTEADAGNTSRASMPRPYKPKKASNSGSKLSLPWRWYSAASRQDPEEPKLPPLEAFSFKSFMADLEGGGGQNDIGADLDRIAEICARSRFSLSNQYEVHVAPHGSGASFISGIASSSSTGPSRRKGPGHGQAVGGPTLQAINPEDESSTRPHPRRRNGAGRRRSAAYSTLETIMSSSRSSEEENTKKKSAAELVGEVRGRAARKAWDTTNPTASASASASVSASASASASAGNGCSGNSSDAANAQQAGSADNRSNRPARKKPASFATAIMDNSTASSDKKPTSSPSSRTDHGRRAKHTTTAPPSTATTTTTTTAPSALLLSEPALPQTSTSHLGVSTTGLPAGSAHASSSSSRLHGDGHKRALSLDTAGLPSPGAVAASVSVSASASAPGDGGGGSSWSAWLPPWGGMVGQGRQQYSPPSQRIGGPSRPSHAEGSLRQLLGRTAAAAAAAGGGV